MGTVFLGVFIGFIGILNMVINAKLAERIGIFHGTLVNYIGATLILLVIIWTKGIAFAAVDTLAAIPLWVYTGGSFGVMVVAGLNVIVPRLPVMFSALITFLGQMTASLVIDWLLGQEGSLGNIVGGILIACGLLYNGYIGNKIK